MFDYTLMNTSHPVSVFKVKVQGFYSKTNLKNQIYCGKLHNKRKSLSIAVKLNPHNNKQTNLTRFMQIYF